MKMRRPRQLHADGQLKMKRMTMLTEVEDRGGGLDSKKGEVKLQGHCDLVTLHFPSQDLDVVPFE